MLAAGQVIESGSHDELTAADGTYARLWRSWSAAGSGTGSRVAGGG